MQSSPSLAPEPLQFSTTKRLERCKKLPLSMTIGSSPMITSPSRKTPTSSAPETYAQPATTWNIEMLSLDGSPEDWPSGTPEALSWMSTKFSSRDTEFSATAAQPNTNANLEPSIKLPPSGSSSKKLEEWPSLKERAVSLTTKFRALTTDCNNVII